MAIHNFDLPNSEQPICSLTSLSPLSNLVPNYLSSTSTNEELWTEIKLLNQKGSDCWRNKCQENDCIGEMICQE
ncbi:6500_t:CDS:2, partial [Scutellospora calospora]